MSMWDTIRDKATQVANAARYSVAEWRAEQGSAQLDREIQAEADRRGGRDRERWC